MLRGIRNAVADSLLKPITQSLSRFSFLLGLLCRREENLELARINSIDEDFSINLLSSVFIVAQLVCFGHFSSQKPNEGKRYRVFGSIELVGKAPLTRTCLDSHSLAQFPRPICMSPEARQNITAIVDRFKQALGQVIRLPQRRNHKFQHRLDSTEGFLVKILTVAGIRCIVVTGNVKQYSCIILQPQAGKLQRNQGRQALSITVFPVDCMGHFFQVVARQSPPLLCMRADVVSKFNSQTSSRNSIEKPECHNLQAITRDYQWLSCLDLVHLHMLSVITGIKARRSYLLCILP